MYARRFSYDTYVHVLPGYGAAGLFWKRVLGWLDVINLHIYLLTKKTITVRVNIIPEYPAFNDNILKSKTKTHLPSVNVISCI